MQSTHEVSYVVSVDNHSSTVCEIRTEKGQRGSVLNCK